MESIPVIRTSKRLAPACLAASVVLLMVLVVVLPSRSAAAPSGSDQPRFAGSIERLDADLRERMTGKSWRRGCPVPLGNLRLLRVAHWGFDGSRMRGYLVVHADASREIMGVMRRLFERRFAIRRMRLVDAYGADDHRSMNADNTSAFNCREVSGRPGVWSQHAYGRAIDVNPIENPYVTTTGHVSPPAGAPFADRRPHRKGMINRRGGVVKAFGRAGWEWGGNWPGTKDYQHFSATGS
ncbi:MAG TPA: M15 family metallopeptidase [Solirubrobacterales bacterium]|nr:M15 family metallopeptidase [Solirubrobacterales bacterium]